ncbi:MAG TPA: DUF423 domain-containing protein [Pseudomonadales bacterium]|nr:DUF423 domain-containing protein [Pseudomonadales bacterium]
MTRLIFIFGAASGLVSVVLGAFAAHGLRGTIDERLEHAFETGVHYQMMHSIVLIVVGLMIEHWGKHWALVWSSWSFALGIVMFSGSLYLLALTSMKWPGPVTPLGGLAFIVGWGLLTVAIWQNTAP